MNIALIGYGKIGHEIERIARARGLNIIAIIDPPFRPGKESRSYHIDLFQTTTRSLISKTKSNAFFRTSQQKTKIPYKGKAQF